MIWNGNQREKKGNDNMKRLAILSVTMIFATSSIAAAQLSFAETNADTTTNRTTQSYDSKSVKTKTASVQKDTSWFEYYDLKDTYEISSEEELLGFASLINENQTDSWKPNRIENFEGVTFVLTDDIKLTTSEWTPIGSGSASYFAGVFDGNGHTISDLKVDSASGLAGFFGYLKGEVRDLTVEGTVKSGDSSCGGIVGQLDPEGKVTGCTADISVTGRDKAGGIAGYNNGGTIELCTNLGEISGTYKVGGIVGENWGGTVDKCANKGKVESSKRGVATYGTGGIAGRSVSSEAEVAHSYNTGDIVSDTEATGGVVGYMNASGSTIIDCYNTAKVIVKNKADAKKIAKSYSGGIVGIAGATDVYIRNCYNSAQVLNADVNGGVVGYYINEKSNPDHVKYLRNNYYLNDSAKTGIGLLENENDNNLSKAAAGISSSSLTGLASSLTAAYKDDMGIYGNNEFPVLEWQESVSEDQRDYMDNVSTDVQKKLDKYIMESSGSSQYGQIILNLFTPDNYINDAMLLYNGNKEGIKNKVEKEK